MILPRVLHQQFMQLRWHLLACLGLIMVLPIEETIVNLRDAQGQSTYTLSTGILLLAPLLAALIACANVQADLDVKRDLFWRSKPVRVSSFISIKFLTGLLLALIVTACPVLFTWGTTLAFHADLPTLGDSSYLIYVLNILLISLLAYSTCFFCNVLVRNTARAWLIGMATVCFTLLIPIMLPLQFKDVAVDVLRWISGTYLILTLGVTLIGFVLAHVAVQRNWHIQANLKGLLWAGTGLVFALSLLVTGQVANLQVLDEKSRALDQAGWGNPIQTDGHILVPDRALASVRSANNTLIMSEVSPALSEFTTVPNEALHRYHDCPEDLDMRIYPRDDRFGHRAGFPLRVGNQTYLMAFFEYYRREPAKEEGDPRTDFHYEKLVLRSFKARPYFTRLDKDKALEPVASLDLSELLSQRFDGPAAIRALGDGLVFTCGNRLVEIQVTDQGELHQKAEERHQPFFFYDFYTRHDRTQSFTIPLVGTEDLDIHQRLRLSIDLCFNNLKNGLRFDRTSVVDMDGKTIRFAHIHDGKVMCFNVIDWNQKEIHCQILSERPFTLLEEMGNVNDYYRKFFVDQGKLYAYTETCLMVFDIRSVRGVRKLGHFQRFQNHFRINDVLVEESGDILLFNEQQRSTHIDDRYINEFLLGIYLLKAPQS